MPPTLLAVSTSASPAAGMSAQMTCAVTGEDLGDGGADAAGGTGDHGDLMSSGLSQDSGAVPSAAPTRNTWASTNADLGRQDEPQRRLQAGQAGLGVGETYTNCTVEPEQFLAERAGGTFEARWAIRSPGS